MDDWFEESRYGEPLHAQDREAVWQMVAARDRRVSRSTRDFVGKWADAVASASSAADLTENTDVRRLVAGREREKKGTRARLAPGNQYALDGWTGASGTGRLDYRWRNVRRHLQDLYDAEGAS